MQTRFNPWDRLTEEDKKEVIDFYLRFGHIYGVRGLSRKFNISYETAKKILKEKNMYKCKECEKVTNTVYDNVCEKCNLASSDKRY